MKKEDVIFRVFGYKPILIDYLNSRLLIKEQIRDDDDRLEFSQNGITDLHQHVQDYILSKDSIAQQMENSSEVAYQAYIKCLDDIITQLSNEQKTIVFVSPPG